VLKRYRRSSVQIPLIGFVPYPQTSRTIELVNNPNKFTSFLSVQSKQLTTRDRKELKGVEEMVCGRSYTGWLVMNVSDTWSIDLKWALRESIRFEVRVLLKIFLR
jgi:hypothetical protein